MQYQELLNKKTIKEKNIETLKFNKSKTENEIQMFMCKYFENINKPFLQMLQEIKNNIARLSIVGKEYSQNLENKQKFNSENNISEEANIEYSLRKLGIRRKSTRYK